MDIKQIDEQVFAKPWFHGVGDEEKRWLCWLLEADAKDRRKYFEAMPKVEIRSPAGQGERDLLCGAWAYRGRGELVGICGASAYAIAHFPLELPILTFLYDHIADESHHSVEMIEWAGHYNRGKRYWEADPEWEGRWGDGQLRSLPLKEGQGWLDYLLYMLPIETGAGLGIRPYDLFKIQLKELAAFAEDRIHSDEAQHFMFFMLSARRALQKDDQRAEFGKRLADIYRRNIRMIATARMKMWDELFIPKLGADATFVHNIPEMRTQRYQFILNALEISEKL
ncbi:hypothetical protein EPO44_19990 [bacterium]|nr:MAG: hypothetical protein EPO44_19990 [bacterium]